MLVGGCRFRFLMRAPYCTLDRRRVGLRMIGMQLALSDSCVSSLQFHASLPRTYDAEIKVPSSSENPALSIPLKPSVGQKKYNLACFACCQEFCLSALLYVTFPVHSTSFSPKSSAHIVLALDVAGAMSHVGPRSGMCRPANRQKRLMQVLVLKPAEYGWAAQHVLNCATVYRNGKSDI